MMNHTFLLRPFLQASPRGTFTQISFNTLGCYRAFIPSKKCTFLLRWGSVLLQDRLPLFSLEMLLWSGRLFRLHEHRWGLLITYNDRLSFCILVPDYLLRLGKWL